ncbi:MAG: amino acid adenylation domain-containing protein [Candidatus Eiseniibacteriota bacterium]|nr:MAG: amino acid adenylation domain-containing protein [Candidatus Eisenbacteria bacterium]
MNMSSKRIADLSPEKRELFLRRFDKETGDVSRTQIRPQRRDSNSFPLSVAQQRLWFLDQLEPGNPAYSIPAAYRVTGRLNVTALEQSLSEIVRRHETLRTSFPVVDGQSVQVISPDVDLTLPLVDLRELPETEWEAEAQRQATEEAQQPFDLARGPLWRVKLLRLSEGEHVFLLTMHHIVSDGWSLGVFMRELVTLYEAFSTGKPSPLPELPIQYADFAVWQRRWLQGEMLESQLNYWKQQLGDSPPVLQLPTDRLRPPVQTYRGARQSLELPKNLSDALKALSQREGVTLFMILLAAFKTLLYRYTGQKDIVVGSPIANRNRAEIEELIGFFANALVIRTDLSGNPSFRELLGRVREVTLGAYAHQDLPFEKLVEELQPERDMSRTPLFDVMVSLVNTPQRALELPGLILEVQKLTESESKFPMTLYIVEHESELSLQLVYQCALFSSERVACLLNQFQYLLEQIVTAPEKPIRSYSLVTPESRSLLPDPSAVLPEPRYELVTSMFATWVNRMPEQPALCQGDQVWTYGELAESAYALAWALLSQGLKQGDVVAVFGPRSFGLIASMMAALLSGGVLLTIDRTLPRNRQRLMLQEAGARCLLYVGGRRPEDEWMQKLSPLLVICVDPDKGEAIGLERASNLEAMHLPELAPDDPAYIFFTSGTTGVPNGVLGCHKGLGHFLNWQRETFAIGPQDRSAQLTGLSFDVVLRDIFLPLTSGATLCLPEDMDSLGPDDIMRWLERERISVLHTVPILAQSWLANVPAEVSLRAMRWVFFAGEPLTETVVRQWRATFPGGGGEIINLYGPTETTLAKCFYQVPADVLPGVQPVGWPMPQTQALVLAENSQLCGIGEPGEIVLRTPFRSLGYINAPEESQKRFVKNPVRDDEQDLLYYTGDRGRYRLDGALEILGRLDDQVKIRGVRVEPGEITVTLARHPAVKSCFVAAKKDEQGQTYLAAYVVAAKQGNMTIPELRSYLSRQLPAVMVPVAFVFLEQLPLTPNGKVDRRALPVPDRARSEDSTFVAPRTPVEERVAETWAQVLGVKQVGVHDDFFELGGHSLLATQVISRLRNAFQVELPLGCIFQAPTVAELSAAIEKAKDSSAEVRASIIVPLSRKAHRMKRSSTGMLTGVEKNA